MPSLTHSLAFILLALFALSANRTLAAAPDDLPHTLWYTHPAKDWQSEALPIGNGRLGAMIFGDAASEHLQLNEISLWTGDEITRGTYQNLGDLTITLGHTDATNYQRSLNLRDALHRVQYTAGGITYTRESFASFPDHVIVVRLTADKPASISTHLAFQDAHQASWKIDGLRLTSAAALNNGLKYETQILLVPQGGTAGSDKEGLQVSNATSLTILISAGTDYLPDSTKHWRGENPHARLTAQLNAAAAKPFDTLLKSHLADVRPLTERCQLDLGPSDPAAALLPTNERILAYQKSHNDPGLENLLFQLGRYFTIASSRDSLPANLQGLWNNSNNPPWGSDYHSNINLQMNYWPTEVTNLSECALPLMNFINAQRAVRTRATHDYYATGILHDKLIPHPIAQQVRGWTVQTEGNIFGAGSWNWNPPASAWYCQHLWEHYNFTQDKEFLRTSAYPILKEVCEFWQDHLIAQPDGSLVSPDGWSPEHGPHQPGVTYDQEIVYDLFTNYLAASTTLNIDPDYRKQIYTLRDKLLKPKIGKWGQLMEWPTDIDDPKDTHRHISHMFAVFPGKQITLAQTPDLAAAAKVSLTARGDISTGWAMAWRICLWARFHDGDHAHALLQNLLRPAKSATTTGEDGGVFGNLFDVCPPFQIDGNFGVTAGIAEMLLQSHTDTIDLLPALPSAWPTGSANGLKARGNVTVNMTWQTGKLTSATFTSPIAQTIKVRTGEIIQPLSLTPNQPSPLVLPKPSP